jgi:hypothetical protein
VADGSDSSDLLNVYSWFMAIGRMQETQICKHLILTTQIIVDFGF